VRRIGLAGTGLNIHALRHTGASRMVEAGADLTLLMAVGGWSSLVNVDRTDGNPPRGRPMVGYVAPGRAKP
jgi:integrase